MMKVEISTTSFLVTIIMRPFYLYLWHKGLLSTDSLFCQARVLLKCMIVVCSCRLLPQNVVLLFFFQSSFELSFLVDIQCKYSIYICSKSFHKKTHLVGNVQHSYFSDSSQDVLKDKQLNNDQPATLIWKQVKISYLIGEFERFYYLIINTR